MGHSLDDAFEATDELIDEREDRLVQDPWWQRIVRDEDGEIVWMQVPRFAHWEDWRLWCFYRRPGTNLWNPVIRIWIQGTRPPGLFQLRRHPLSHGLLVLKRMHILPSPWSGLNCLTGKPVVSPPAESEVATTQGRVAAGRRPTAGGAFRRPHLV